MKIKIKKEITAYANIYKNGLYLHENIENAKGGCCLDMVVAKLVELKGTYEVEEEWQPKEGEKVFKILLHNDILITETRFLNNFDCNYNKYNLIFPTRELAEARLKEIQEFLTKE